MHSLRLQSVVPLLLITYFLSINVESSLSQDDLPYANCGEDINCGGIRLSYPFRGVNRANYCGPPGCQGGLLGNYLSSPQTYVNTNINFSLFEYTSGLTNLTFYYGCASINIPGLNSSSQPCDTNNDNVTYVVGSLPIDPVANGTCKNGVSIPVFTTAALALEANRTTIKEVEGSVGLTRKMVNSVAFASIRMQPYVMQLHPEQKTAT
ncbi:LEAF RUST 10 DISEASE-RESISTANCE LOCUS RECEPTOR-LIKE PROTEIN KINASE-like 2.1 [Prunus yedoensis var. nudiflora]|uniref:LEAF RUST 10 DISEASE-RESISTANCE LOCUS RECEPTOR-LIKE PROTEIN KINASE-like 2.1 n=1 Tax=Prunus yedoensis var. nudiflora TaxID=2094558 RepID=A0A314UTS9_PRUYE|nr:LEAF RUST 10 DISEASE-RESISTANCE LOCUS RECEPTOR-LIKE PROTEIN KINASE-like 2.1 [Prunus yedoensis var. nudiflora]